MSKSHTRPGRTAKEARRRRVLMRNSTGSSFDDFLKEEGIYDECLAAATQDIEVLIGLSLEDSIKIAEMILNPPTPTPDYLKKAKESYVRLIRKSC